VTNSKAERILTAIETVLVGTANVGTRIYRDRAEAVARNECPAIVFEPITEKDKTTGTLERTDTEMIVRFGILVNGTPVSKIADPIRVSLHSRLMADPSLGGLAQSIWPHKREYDPAPGEIGVVVCDYRVLFRTLLEDVTQ
jgi:hypothetical protein